MAAWYWMKDGRKRGPVDTAHLKQMAQAGEVEPTDMIWRDGLPNWVPASQAKGLVFGPSHTPQAAQSAEVETTASTPDHASAAQRRFPSRGIVKYRCPRCRAVLESEEGLAGKQDECPSCGRATIVPLESSAGAK